MKYLKISDWLQTTHRLPCLDVRSAREFVESHLIGAGNIPWSEMEERIHELPRKGGELFVVGGGLAREAAEALFIRRRWQIAWSDEELSGLPVEVLSAGKPEPLWRPNSWLAEHWREIPPGGKVFDVAMGSGRNAVFMATRGYRVTGEDILPDAVLFARSLADRLEVQVDTRVGDLRRDDPIEGGAWDGIMVFNYLDRKLFPALQGALAPGGVLIYETFLEEQGRRVGRPGNLNWLLKPGELERSFPELEVLTYREGNPEPDRYVAGLVARRPRE